MCREKMARGVLGVPGDETSEQRPTCRHPLDPGVMPCHWGGGRTPTGGLTFGHALASGAGTGTNISAFQHWSKAVEAVKAQPAERGSPTVLRPHVLWVCCF